MTTKKFNIKSSLNSRIIYKNLNNFFARLDKNLGYVKVIVKVGSKQGNKTRFLSLSQFSYLDLNNNVDLTNYLNICTNNFSKLLDNYSPINPNELYITYSFITKKEYLNKYKFNSWAPKTINFKDFEFPLTVDYKSLSDNVTTKKTIANTKYVQYSDCKGFKGATNTSFVVTNIHSDKNLEINNVTLKYNKLTYTFTDILNKMTGEVTRRFTSSEQVVSSKFKSSSVKNVGTIDPLISNGIQNEPKFLTLDCETYLVNNVQKLLSVATFDGNKSKFYFVSEYKNDFDLVKAVLLDLMNYPDHNIYIHNGIRFDLVFLFKHFIKVAKESGFTVDVIYKDGELLNVSVIDNSNKKNLKVIQFKDSLKLLLGSLSKLAKTFGISEGKGVFPFDFASPNNFSYVGPTPDYKYFAFNGKPLISKEIYNNLFSSNWSFVEELKAYNIQDCVVLYNIMSKFDQLIRSKFNFNFHNNPTLSSLAFSLYRYGYIPENLQYTKEVGKQKQIKSLIDSLNENYDVFVRQSYFGGHVDSYIPYYDPTRAEHKQLYHYDVVSLYPYIMQQYKLPYKISQEVEGNLLVSNKELFDTATGFYKVRVTSPLGLANPLLPYKNSKGIVVYPEGSWTGIYYSEEIKNCIKYGYKFEIISGYLFDTDFLFTNYISDLFNIKQSTPKADPMYHISKILMNSLYGKFGIHFKLPTFGVYNKEQINSGEFNDMVDLENGYYLGNEANNGFTVPFSNVAIASAITALARVHMSQFKNHPDFNLYYTDTDSAIIDSPLSESLVGNNLGQMTLENTYSKFITFGPKFYGGVTQDGQEIIKIKGLSHAVLPTFSELEMLLEKGKFLEKEQTKVFKDIGLSEITLKNLPYLLKPTENKREFNYSGDKIISTRNKIITE